MVEPSVSILNAVSCTYMYLPALHCHRSHHPCCPLSSAIYWKSPPNSICELNTTNQTIKITTGFCQGRRKIWTKVKFEHIANVYHPLAMKSNVKWVWMRKLNKRRESYFRSGQTSLDANTTFSTKKRCFYSSKSMNEHVQDRYIRFIIAEYFFCGATEK